MTAVCIRCGVEKELALTRCPGCGLVPAGDDRALSVLASRRMLGEAELAEVRRRIRTGEPFRPARARLALATAVLAGSANIEPFAFTRASAVSLLLANVLLTPALGFAVWFGVRHRPGLGARQALWLTVPVAGLLAVGRVVIWKFGPG